VRTRALPRPLHLANEGFAFLLELAALAALAWWGATIGTTTAVCVLLGTGAPLAAAVVWGLFAAPRARIRLPIAGVIAVKALVFGCASVGIYALGRARLAISFGLIALANSVVAALDRDATARASRDR
jgi:hypothetical protein